MHNNDDRHVSPWEDGANQVVDLVNKVIHEGTVRQVSIEREGRVVAQFPLLFGVLGTALAPGLAVISGIAAMATDCKIRLARTDGPTREVWPVE